MKVVTPGVLFFHRGLLVTQQWVLDLEGVRYTDPTAERHAVTRAIFDFLCEHYAGGRTVVADPTQCVTAEVERETQDVIAMCRWREQGPA